MKAFERILTQKVRRIFQLYRKWKNHSSETTKVHKQNLRSSALWSDQRAYRIVRKVKNSYQSFKNKT